MPPSVPNSPTHEPNQDFTPWEQDNPESGDGKRGNPSERRRRLIFGILGRWYWIVIFGVLGFVISNYRLSRTPDRFTATATLTIKHQVAPALVNSEVQEISMASQEGMNTVAARLARYELLEGVGSREDVLALKDMSPPPADWAPAWYRKLTGRPGPVAPEPTRNPATIAGMIGSWMDISVRRGTRLIDIRINHTSPEVASTVANAIAREYLAEIYHDSSANRNESVVLLQRQADEARERLRVAGGAFSTYQRALDFNRVLDEKEAGYHRLQQRYLPKHPRMQEATSDLETTRKRFLEAFESARRAVSDKAYWDEVANSLPDSEVNPSEYLSAARQQLLSRTGVLQNEISSSETLFRTMLSRIEDININREAGGSSAEISSFSRPPGWPSSPDRKKLLTTGTMAGLGAGLVIAWLLMLADNKFHTVAQVTSETGVSVLAAIAEIKPSHINASERDALKDSPDADFSSTLGWHEFLLFRPGTSSTVYAEMFRVLRTSVSLLGDESKRKITLFTSALPGEGKSSVSANFALASASAGKKTILVDLDLRKPSLHTLFGVSRASDFPGISECLANLQHISQIIRPAEGLPNLHLILSGRVAPNPGELLNQTSIKALFDYLVANYEVVVIDTAPLLPVPDTRLLTTLAHNICLVVRAEFTRKGAVHRALDILEKDQAKLSGIVVNGYREKRRLIGDNYSYGYYQTNKYGSYGTYGYGSYGSEQNEEETERQISKRREKRSRKLSRK